MPNDGVPSACSRRTDLVRPDREQLVARHLEEAHRVFVALDEAGRRRRRARRSPPVRSRPACGSAPRSRGSPLRPALRSVVSRRQTMKTSRRSSRTLLTPISASNSVPLRCRPLVSRGARSTWVSSTDSASSSSASVMRGRARRATGSAGRASGRGPRSRRSRIRARRWCSASRCDRFRRRSGSRP